MDNSIHLFTARSAQLSKFGIRFTGGNTMRTTTINLMGNRPNEYRRQVNPFARVISFLKIRVNESPSSIDAARLAQITRNTRPMVGIGPIIRNR
jgi:hypothetical protein